MEGCLIKYNALKNHVIVIVYNMSNTDILHIIAVKLHTDDSTDIVWIAIGGQNWP